jgi:PAS domain S-box-containing protein
MNRGNPGEYRLQATYKLLESLQESHDRYLSLVDAISDVVFEHDANGLAFLNRAWTEIFGHAIQDSLGLTLLGYVIESEQILLNQWLTETRIRPKQSVKTELHLRHHDGRERWVEINGCFDDATQKHAGIIRDITAAKAAELGLIESQGRFRQLIDSAPVMIWIAGLDMLCHYFNKFWLDFTGRSLEQEMGNGWAEGVHPDDLKVCMETYVTAFKARRPFSMDYRLRRHDGAYRWIQDNGTPQFDVNGRFTGYIGSCIDVTERIEAVQLFRSLVEASPIAMLLIDDQGLIELANAQLARMFGYEIQDLIGQTVEVLVPDSHRQAHKQQRRSFAQNPQTRQMGIDRTVMGKCRDGTSFPVEVGLSPAKLNGRDYVVAVTVDITERKRAEQEILDLNENLEQKVRERTAELAVASAAKTKFLAHMSHEIRTPLNAVLGIAQLLGKEPFNPGQHAMVRHISEAGELLLHIVNDILDLSKIEAGQFSLECLPFRPQQVIDNVRNMMVTAACSKGLLLEIDASPDLPTELMGDAMRLEQVLLNLINNAIKFTERGSVCLGIQLLQSDGDTARLRFEVRDTGIGLDSAAQAKLFKPFSQADDTITRRFGGTGLGLSISKYLVEHMGGSMGLVSEPGQGSTFWFEIDFATSQRPAADLSMAKVGELATGDSLAGLQVLLVDDNRINLMVGQRALELEGASVVTATDGQQALERLHAAPADFDVVLMDIQMPVMDGLTATREIRRNTHLCRLPIVALTAGVLPEERAAAEQAGMDDFLTKPLVLADMITTLLRAIRTRTSA